MERSQILDLLRQEASQGVGVSALVDLMRVHVDGDLSAFVAVSLLMDALHLPLSAVRELPGARCLGGGVYSDAEIDRLLRPVIGLPPASENLVPP